MIASREHGLTLPLVGRVGAKRRGEGRAVIRRWTPTPHPSPQGGGEHTEYAAGLCVKRIRRCLGAAAKLLVEPPPDEPDQPPRHENHQCNENPAHSNEGVLREEA